METQKSKSPHTLCWIAGTAVTVFSAVGVAAVMGWIPTSTGSSTEIVAQAPPAAVKTPTAAQIEAKARQEAHARADAREQARDEARADRQEQARDQARADKKAQARLAKAQCAECGVVVSVREIDTKGEGSGLGAVGGAVVGGVLGNQVGDGSGRRIATVAGAVGGAVAGHQIERHVKSATSYEITIRMESGASRVMHEATAPSWRAGDKVRIVNGAIQSNA
jgi:outer membrane lipoprotein SlyB